MSNRHDYFEWLCHLVRGEGHFCLLHTLFSISFFSIVPHDENRAQDGLWLRWEFARDMQEDIPCTVLEMLIMLAKRVAYELQDSVNERDTGEIFWEMMHNIGLDSLDDDCFHEVEGRYIVEETVRKVLDRTYRRNGDGGLFPLRKTTFDQREVELWYQAQAYICENYLALN